MKVKIPSELSDIRLSQYQKYIDLTKESEDVKWMNRQLIKCFCKDSKGNFLTDETVGQIKKKDFDSLVNHVSTLINSAADYFDGTKSIELKTIIEHEGRELGFIPSMYDLTLDEVEQIKLGEFEDSIHLHKELETYDRLMGVLYRPIKSKRKGQYLIEAYTGKEKPLDLTLDVVFGAIVFFYDLMNDLLKYIPNSIRQQVSQPQTQKILEQNGVATKEYMQSLKATCSILRERNNYPFIRV